MWGLALAVPARPGAALPWTPAETPHWTPHPKSFPPSPARTKQHRRPRSRGPAARSPCTAVPGELAFRAVSPHPRRDRGAGAEETAPHAGLQRRPLQGSLHHPQLRSPSLTASPARSGPLPPGLAGWGPRRGRAWAGPQRARVWSPRRTWGTQGAQGREGRSPRCTAPLAPTPETARGRGVTFSWAGLRTFSFRLWPSSDACMEERRHERGGREPPGARSPQGEGRHGSRQLCATTGTAHQHTGRPALARPC